MRRSSPASARRSSGPCSRRTPKGCSASEEDAMTNAPRGRSLPPLTATRVHHVGYAVASLDRALEFWEAFLGVERLWRTVLDRPYLGRHVGYPGVKIDAAFVPLPGGAILELLEYQLADRPQNPEATANPGNAHICLA